MGLFRKGKIHFIAKLHGTDLVICSHSREGEPCLIAKEIWYIVVTFRDIRDIKVKVNSIVLDKTLSVTYFIKFVYHLNSYFP